MNKSEMTACIANVLKEHGPRKSPTALASLVVDTLTVAVAQALQSGTEVILPGLGKLKPKVVAAKAERPGRNPKTGEAITIPAQPERKAVKFKAAYTLDAALNGQHV